MLDRQAAPILEETPTGYGSVGRRGYLTDHTLRTFITEVGGRMARVFTSSPNCEASSAHLF